MISDAHDIYHLKTQFLVSDFRHAADHLIELKQVAVH